MHQVKQSADPRDANHCWEFSDSRRFHGSNKVAQCTVAMWCRSLCSAVCVCYGAIFLRQFPKGYLIIVLLCTLYRWANECLFCASDIFRWIFKLLRHCIGFFSFRALVFATIAKSFTRSLASNQSEFRMNVSAQRTIDLRQFLGEATPVSYEFGRLNEETPCHRGAETQGRIESTSKSYE